MVEDFIAGIVKFAITQAELIVSRQCTSLTGTPLLQRSEKLSNGPFDVPNSVPAALANKKCGKDGGKTRTRAFWNRLRRFTGVLTACATHPQSQMYDRLR